MHLTRLIATATAAALFVCPAIAAAQGGDAAQSTAPSSAPAPATTPPPPAAAAVPAIPPITPGPDLYDTAKASGQFTILIKAIDATNLASTLKNTPNVTLFAPTDAAFNALPPGVLAKLMEPGNLSSLQQILLYHLVGAQVDETKIRGAKGPVKTAEGESINLDGSNPVLKANDADILADVHTANGGVLNAIDKVLVPPNSAFAAQLTPAPAPAQAAPAAPGEAAPGAAPAGAPPATPPASTGG